MNDVLISRNKATGIIYAAAAKCDKCISKAKSESAKDVIGDVKALIVHIAQLVEAIGPPEKKPLEFGMIFGGVVYIEYRDKPELEPVVFDVDDNTYAGMARYSQFGTANRSYVDVDLYGSFWRCWAGRPTQEEREDAEWE